MKQIEHAVSAQQQQQLQNDSYNIGSASSLDSFRRGKSIDSEKEASPPIIRNDKKSTFFNRVPPKTASIIPFKHDQQELHLLQLQPQQPQYTPYPHFDSFRLQHSSQFHHSDPLRRMTIIEHPPRQDFIRALTPPTIPRRKSAEGRIFGFINQKISFCDQLAPFNPNYWFFQPKPALPIVEFDPTSPVNRKPKEGPKTRVFTVIKQQGNSDGASSTAADYKKRKSFAAFKEEDLHSLQIPLSSNNNNDFTSTRKASRLATVVPQESTPVSLSNTTKNSHQNGYSSLSFSQKFTSLSKEFHSPTQKNTNNSNTNQSSSTNNNNHNHPYFESPSDKHPQHSSQQRQQHQNNHQQQQQLQQMFQSKTRILKPQQSPQQKQVQYLPVTFPSQKEFFLKGNFLKPKSSQLQLQKDNDQSPQKDSSQSVLGGFSRLKKFHTASAKNITLPSSSSQSTNQSTSMYSIQFEGAAAAAAAASAGTQSQSKAISHRAAGEYYSRPLLTHSKTSSKHSISEFIASETQNQPKRTIAPSSSAAAIKASQYLFSQVYIANNPLYQKKKQQISRTMIIPSTPRQTSNQHKQPANIIASTKLTEQSSQQSQSNPSSFGETNQPSSISAEVQQDQQPQNHTTQHSLHSHRETKHVKSSIGLPQINHSHKRSLNSIALPSNNKTVKTTSNNTNNLNSVPLIYKKKRKTASITHF